MFSSRERQLFIYIIREPFPEEQAAFLSAWKTAVALTLRCGEQPVLSKREEQLLIGYEKNSCFLS
jgi:hypothetical protein